MCVFGPNSRVREFISSSKKILSDFHGIKDLVSLDYVASAAYFGHLADYLLLVCPCQLQADLLDGVLHLVARYQYNRLEGVLQHIIALVVAPI